jgi:hypothetical protein
VLSQTFSNVFLFLLEFESGSTSVDADEWMIARNRIILKQAEKIFLPLKMTASDNLTSLVLFYVSSIDG